MSNPDLGGNSPARHTGGSKVARMAQRAVDGPARLLYSKSRKLHFQFNLHRRGRYEPLSDISEESIQQPVHSSFFLPHSSTGSLGTSLTHLDLFGEHHDQ